MATYSISKTITLYVQCTSSKVRVDDIPAGTYTKPRTEYTYLFNYATFSTKYIDFSEIPASATITDITLQKSGDSGYGIKSYNLKDEGGQVIGGITATAIEDYLSTGSRIFGLEHGFQPTGHTYHSYKGETITIANTVTYTITVTYEASSVIINYGTKDGWKQCVPYYCSNGRYVPVQPYYGINGEWIKAGASDD